MTSFRFNFQAEGGTSGDDTKTSEATEQASGFQARELHLEGEGAPLDCEEVRLEVGFHLKKGLISTDTASALLKSSSLSVSDLLPGEYEGGFKLWECAIDLAKYLSKLWGVNSISRFQPSDLHLLNYRVLELGCGHGLPGILAALLGAEVHFQDYNEEVLSHVTAPNLAVNLDALPPASRALMQPPRYFAGSWASLRALIRSEKLSGTYDLVLTSDTIYSAQQQQHLLGCILEALRPGGTAFVAAKSYYFGVGGGVENFQAAAAAAGSLEVQDEEVLCDQRSNVRKIIKLRKLDNEAYDSGASLHACGRLTQCSSTGGVVGAEDVGTYECEDDYDLESFCNRS